MTMSPLCCVLFPYTTLFRSRHRLQSVGGVDWRAEPDLGINESAGSDEVLQRVRVQRPRVRDVPDVALEKRQPRSEEHTSELQSLAYLVCRLLLVKISLLRLN